MAMTVRKGLKRSPELLGQNHYEHRVAPKKNHLRYTRGKPKGSIFKHPSKHRQTKVQAHSMIKRNLIEYADASTKETVGQGNKACSVTNRVLMTQWSHYQRRRRTWRQEQRLGCPGIQTYNEVGIEATRTNASTTLICPDGKELKCKMDQGLALHGTKFIPIKIILNANHKRSNRESLAMVNLEINCGQSIQTAESQKWHPKDNYVHSDEWRARLGDQMGRTETLIMSGPHQHNVRKASGRLQSESQIFQHHGH